MSAERIYQLTMQAAAARAGWYEMMRRLLQPFWVLLAVIFLIEAWLWDHLEPVVARIVALIPLRDFKHAVRWIEYCRRR